MQNHSIQDLSLEKRIAQMIILGFSGPKLQKHPSIEIEIKETGIGGIVLFDKDMIGNKGVNNIQNPNQVKQLITEAQQLANIPLFISIDQEGGKVARLRQERGFMEFPSAKILGEVNDADYTYEISKAHAKMLKWLGFNVNFAPCVDLSINKESPIIFGKERSFGEQVRFVNAQAEAFSKAMMEEGILSCPKHFPGHGSSSVDSHKGLTDISNTWSNTELAPYAHLIESGLSPMIMIGHLILRQYDEQLPASLSKKILDKLLKERLNFDGLVTTDDLQMKAISDHYSLKETLVMAINAGSDLLIFGNNLLPEYVTATKIIDLLTKAVKEGELTEDRINESCDRILKAKQRYLTKD